MLLHYGSRNLKRSAAVLQGLNAVVSKRIDGIDGVVGIVDRKKKRTSVGFFTLNRQICRALIWAALGLIALGCGEQEAPKSRPEAPLAWAKKKAESVETAGSGGKKAAPLVAVNGASDTAKISPALRETRARIETITAKAAAMVRRVEGRAPDRMMLLRLDKVFIDTRREMTTDKRLAELGRQLTETEKAAAARFTKARYEALKGRVAAAGKRHRAEARALKPTTR